MRKFKTGDLVVLNDEAKRWSIAAVPGVLLNIWTSTKTLHVWLVLTADGAITSIAETFLKKA